METRNCIKTFVCIFLIATLGLPLAVVANSDPPSGGATPQTAQDDNATMYLGKIEVRGEKNIVKTLQAIKIGLEQPYSSDPKMQNVVVCRITNDIGSHVNQILTCATNRTIATRQSLMRDAFTTPIPTGGGEEARINVLNEAVQDAPSNILQTRVNGPALHGLLEKVPYPQGYTPAPTPTTAPAAPIHD